MVLHYLKVAIRNLLAHKTQTLVSLFGLAIAFACVSLATYWNHYERTYDAFQKNADCIYQVSRTGDKSISPLPLHLYLKEKFPEVEATCAIRETNGGGSGTLHRRYTGFNVSVNGVVYPEKVSLKGITSETLNIFDFKWVEGNKEVMTYGNRQVAISEQLARCLYGETSPLGQTLELLDDEYGDKDEYEIVGVYKGRARHSNLSFDIITPLHPNENWNSFVCHTYVLLKPDVNHEDFIRKIKTDTIRHGYIPQVYDLAVPLSTMRYTHPESEMNVRLEDVNLFTTAAVLLSLCALLNYLTLFVSRLRARGRDMALRTICGSSGWQMGGLLLMEYFLLLFGALLVGMLFMEGIMTKFADLAMVQVERSAVFLSCGYLMLFILVLAILLSSIPIFYFKRKTLRVQIEAVSVRMGNNYFRMVGVCVQLIVGMLFMFCAVVMMKQIHMLINIDNIERKQIAWVSAKVKDIDVVYSVLQQQPFIKEMLTIQKPLYPSSPHLQFNISDWDGKSADVKGIKVASYAINDEIALFYGLRMKEGASSFELGKNEVFINETLANSMNMDNPVGKTLDKRYQIKGIIYDYQIQAPNAPLIPIYYTSPSSAPKSYVAFKYDGDWKTCAGTLEKKIREKGVQGRLSLEDGEEYYQYFLKSEYNLLKLLGVITVVSILIAIFGIYALIMQSCDQHRKEIAIRKVHGAGVMDILLMFFKQYMMQVVVAAVFAFPIGYYLMKNWLEQYARQTSISLWIYLCIFLGISLLVTLCIGWRVWKAANENPAWVIKKE